MYFVNFQLMNEGGFVLTVYAKKSLKSEQIISFFFLTLPLVKGLTKVSFFTYKISILSQIILLLFFFTFFGKYLVLEKYSFKHGYLYTCAIFC